MTNTRQWIIRTLLVTLTIAAFAGAVGILFGGNDLTWRIIGSAFTISMGCLFFQCCNGLSRVDHAHHAGLLGMLLTGIEFVMVLSLIWVVDSGFYGYRNLWEVMGITALTLPLTGLLGMVGLYLYNKPDNRLAALKLLGVAGVGQLLLMVATIVDSYDLITPYQSRENLWWTAWGAIGYGLLAVLILAGGIKGKSYKFIGLVSVSLAWFMLLYGLWIEQSDRAEFFALATIVSILFAHANAIWLMTVKPGFQSMTRLTVAVLAITTGLFAQCAATKVIFGIYKEEMIRLAGAFGFMAVCGTFALLVIHAANRRNLRRRTQEESLLVYKQITLTCPHCQTVQTLPVGESQCIQCSMQFQIKLFEPHCPHCDYLLVNNTSPTCPECGKPVKAQV